MTNNYQPKGGMCMSCQYKARNCERLKFNEMPVIARYGNTAIVRCVQHTREATIAGLAQAQIDQQSPKKDDE